MKRILLLTCFISTAAFAQQPTDLKEIQQIANNLSVQRNQAMDGVAVLQAKLQIAEEKIKELEQKVKTWEELQDKKDKKAKESEEKK
jgi:flagellar biosynthesis chaperone FliJ